MATISAKTKEHPEAVSVEFDLPTDVAGLVERFGEAAVASAAVDSITISVQALLRRHINKSTEELQMLVNEFKPGTRTRGPSKSPLEKAMEALASLSPEDRKALLQKHRHQNG